MAVLAFCERNGLTNMLNLLRHSGGPNLTSTQEVFALDVLQDLVGKDPVKKAALQTLRTEVHPVFKAQAFYATAKRHESDIAAVKQSINELEGIIADMRRTLQGPIVKSAKTNGEDDEETQKIPDQDAQNPYPESDSEASQPEQASIQKALL
jgi:hypothetical protein